MKNKILIEKHFLKPGDCYRLTCKIYISNCEKFDIEIDECDLFHRLQVCADQYKKEIFEKWKK